MTVSNPTDFNPGDVILLSYPFGEGSGVRKRPALVVSSSAFNQETGELVVAQITSRVSAPARAGDYAIAEWREAKLPRPALVRAPGHHRRCRQYRPDPCERDREKPPPGLN